MIREPFRGRAARPGMARLAVAGALLLAVVLSPSARAPAQTLNDQSILLRLEKLERDIQALNRNLGGAGKTVSGLGTGRVTTESPAFARLEVRVSAIEEDIRNATGQVERLGFELRKLSQRLETVVADMEERLAGLEGGSPAAPADRAALDTPPDPEMPKPPATSILPEGNAEDQYAFAFELLQRARYSEAELALKQFMIAHPDDPLAENARYWLGESYYARGQFALAAQTFLNTYQANKTGNKAADSLLKLGMSMAELDRTSEACATFSEIDKEFPDASPRIKKKVADEKKRIGCS